MRENNLRQREESALQAAIQLRRSGFSQQEIADRIREDYGVDVDPPIVAMAAVAQVNSEPLKQKVTPEVERATEKLMKQRLDQEREKA